MVIGVPLEWICSSLDSNLFFFYMICLVTIFVFSLVRFYYVGRLLIYFFKVLNLALAESGKAAISFVIVWPVIFSQVKQVSPISR